MDEKEKEIMDLLVLTHNKYIKLEPTHPSDLPDWINGIHRLQDILNRRTFRRDYPEEFPTIPPTIKDKKEKVRFSINDKVYVDNYKDNIAIITYNGGGWVHIMYLRSKIYDTLNIDRLTKID